MGVEGITTAHGLRATFKTWGGETGRDRTLIELCLSHAHGDRVEQAYLRSDLLMRRREVMDAWADHVTGAAESEGGGLGGRAVLLPRASLRRTPGPPPFASMNATPASSRAARIAATVAGRSTSPRSRRAMVSGETFAAAASSRTPSPRAARAIRDWIAVMS